MYTQAIYKLCPLGRVAGQSSCRRSIRTLTSVRALFLLVLGMSLGCSAVPERYLREAVPNLTYSTLSEAPQTYQDCLVVLGAVLTQEERRDGAVWLHVKNRPLDNDYRPQFPHTPQDPEAGAYWIVVETPQMLPRAYHHWAEMTVVGRVIGVTPDHQPILAMVYVRGWGMPSTDEGVWEHVIDMNYIPSRPPSTLGEVGLDPMTGPP